MMKKKFKKCISFALVLMMMISGWPIAGDNIVVSEAANLENLEESGIDKTIEKNEKITADVDDLSTGNIEGENERAELELISSGSCGENLTWELTTDGTLTISGEGNMDDYSPGWSIYSPWNGNPKIYNVIIANSVTSIGDYAFNGCQNVTSVIIPDSVNSIGKGAFAGCNNLKNVTIPDSVNSIGFYAFAECSELENITLPKSITSIERNTFSDCYKLSEIIIPDSVINIGDAAFDDCCNLSEVVIPDSVTNIGDSAFFECNSLTNIVLSKSLTSIGKITFAGCTNLSSIEIPNGVTSIGDSAFSDCSNLNNISIPDSMSYIGFRAFWNCSSLTDIILPDSVNYIGTGAFENCLGLTSISLPYQVTIIEDYTFFGCSNLKDITIPEGITEIGVKAFEGCSSLNNIKLPDTVSNIGSYAFSGCTSLERITIPDGVSKILAYTFYACSSLKCVTIPKTVETIGSYAFYRCKNLTDVYYGGNEEEWSEIDKTYLNNATIHYNSTFNYGDLIILEFTEWNEETQIASFSTGISYHIGENTDMSFLNSLDELLGQTVLVVVDRSEIGLLKGIYPVDKIVGNISEWSPSSITLNGTEYPAAKDYSFNGLLPPPDTTSVCYLHDGTVVGVISAEEKTGTLDEWNGSLNEATIDGKIYSVETENLSFLQSIHNWIGHTVRYVLLDGIVIEISLPDYSETYTGKLESYDEESGVLNFSDGESYPISDDLDELPKDYIGKWGVYTINISQSEGIQITDIEPVKTELGVTLTISKRDIYYKDGQFGFDDENFEGRSDFEIPYTLMVESKTNANKDVISQLKEEPEYDITVEDVNIEIPSGFNFGWVFNEGNIQAIDKGTVLHAGDTLGAEGYIRPSLGFSPEEVSMSYSIISTVKTSSEEYMSKDSFTVTDTDASLDQFATTAGRALSDISDNISLSSLAFNDFFDQSTGQSIANALLSIALLAKYDEPSLKEDLTEEVFNQVFGDWKLPTGAATYDVPVKIAVDTKTYGELIFQFTMHITSFNLNGSTYGILGSIDYDIIGGKGMEELQEKNPAKMHGINVGVISKCNVQAFCDAAYQLAEKEIQKSYNKFWGDDANKAADIIFGQTVTDILKENDTSFSKIAFKIITAPTTSIVSECPVDVYLYNKDGELCASIVNNQIEKTSDSIYLEVVGDTKIVNIWDGAYDIKFVSNGSGDMDVTVTEYAGMNNILRTVEFYNIPLGENIDYFMDLPSNLLINNYELVDNESKNIKPDRDNITLETLDPEENIHIYGDPEFTWSDDYKNCTIIFSCEDGDDEQKIECTVFSETTDPTCVVDGKTIYTATAVFDGKEYIDTKEKAIPATGHTYKYTDNGDGTHTKSCTSGDDTATEPHIYQDSTCTYCGAKEHVHEYGTPEFKWSEDYTTCTMVFTCKDGDDQQSIKCEVTKEVTDATCTENGKIVYIARGTFDGNKYIDVKEQEIPASGHAYGTPEYHWSEDYQICTAVFTCESCDDEQKIECNITSETTDPTCTEAGNTVYTATVTFAGKEYTDTQEETISATGHTYEYTDNGDGTHTKVCTAGDDTAIEPHTYQDGICTFCGAEEPEGHTHIYGEPKFTWSDDYSSCTATFTCADGDDQQIVECTVTSKDNGDGTVSYTAVAEFNGKSYTAEQVVDIQDEPDEKPESGKPTESGDDKNSGDSADTNSADADKGVSENKMDKESVSDVKTGDDSNLVLWGLLMVSMLSAGTVVLRLRKKYVK